MPWGSFKNHTNTAAVAATELLSVHDASKRRCKLWTVTDNPVVRILWAAETGNVDVINEMLDKDASLITAADADGYTPLHRASYEGHCHAVEVCTSYLTNH